MKINIQRLVKVCTSAIAVFTVLVASLCVPALASDDGIYEPSENVYMVIPEGDTETVVFHFDVDQLYLYTSQSQGNSVTYRGMHSHNVNTAETKLSIDAYPLGVYRYTNQNMTSGVVDIRDFKKRSVLNVTMVADLTIDFKWQVYSYDSYSIAFNSFYSIYYYDEAGNFVRQDSSSPVRQNLVLSQPDTGVLGTQSYTPIQYSVTLTIPDNAAYMLPRVTTAIYMDNAVAPVQIKSVQASTHPFSLSISRSLILEQTETLQAIEDRLGDLNDKMDDLVNGTPEQQEDYKDSQNQMQDIDEGLADAMAQLDALDNVDLVSTNKPMKDFLTEDGWKDIKILLSPIWEVGVFTTIMLIVLSLVNLSVILFGR